VGSGRTIRLDKQRAARLNAKTMRLHPLGLVIRESLYYLIATANDYENPVQFALHRLSSAEVVPLPGAWLVPQVCCGNRC
jgi:hypothetical protein